MKSSSVVVVGPEEFEASLQRQGVESARVDWRPPAASEALLALEQDVDSYRLVQAANTRAIETILAGRCRVIDVQRAGDVVPGLDRGTLLHAGPPIDWEHASGPLRGALAGATVYESWAATIGDAELKLARGDISLSPCHEHDAVGPMAGVISPSMPVFLVENLTFGTRAYSTMNEGLGRVLRYGANDPSVIDRLKWLAAVVAPLMGAAIRRADGVDLTGIMAQALNMGDELHNRNTAATSLFVRQLAGDLCKAVASLDTDIDDAMAVFHFLAATDVFFLNLGMAACKAVLDPATGIAGSTVVTAMARNGTEFGIWLSGTGREWHTAPAPGIDGLFFPGYGPEDANPDLGDSAITETAGLGGFALAAAPGIVDFVGGTVGAGVAVTEEMYEITLAEHTRFRIPSMGGRGTPVGIDARMVCRTRLTPVLDTGIAHRQAGIGQIGAGTVRVPIGPFVAGFEKLVAGLALSS